MDAETLPPLREDLRLIPGPPGDDGAPTWTLHDPVRQRFFRIGWLQFELLRRWSLGSPQKVLDALRQESTLRPQPDDLERLRRFLLDNTLLSPKDPAARARLARGLAMPTPPLWKTILHSYLFLRIPLLAPDRMLAALLPWTAFLFTPWFRRLLLTTGGLGLFLVSRQWDLFWSTFLRFFSWEGAVWYAVALVLVKLLHELGHALTAKRLGLSVPSMGVAFLVMWPVLYSDLSDAWRLADRRQRMAITRAGVATELGIALIATLAWNLVEDGPFRHILFFLATTSWVTSLALNLNPFMRFDGYFLLADAWEMPNLQERAFALARWQWRRLLAGMDLPKPEHLHPTKEFKLLAYATLCWVYRLVLFTSIALFVYHFFFKLLGLMLFLVEMGWFVLGPIHRELLFWWRHRSSMTWTRGNLLATTLLLLILAGSLLPWNQRVVAPALLKAAHEASIHAPAAGRILTAHGHRGASVPKDALLLELDAPDLLMKEQEARLHILTLETDLARQEGNPNLVGMSAVTRQALAQVQTNLEGLHREMQRLHILAPIPGTLVEWAEGLEPGRWLARGERLGRIADPRAAAITAYLKEEDLQQVDIGAPCAFQTDQRERNPLECTIRDISPFAANQLEEAELGTPHGGGIEVDPTPDGRLLPRQSIYRLTVKLSDPTPSPSRVERGVLVIQGRARAPLARMGNTLQSLWLRESGF